jgi:hypothetical protein
MVDDEESEQKGADDGDRGEDRRRMFLGLTKWYKKSSFASPLLHATERKQTRLVRQWLVVWLSCSVNRAIEPGTRDPR